MKRLFYVFFTALVVAVFSSPALLARDSDNPNYSEGMQLLMRGDYKQAEAKLHEASKTIRNPHLYVNLGNACRANSHWTQAVEAYQRAMELDKKYAPAYTHMGRCFELMGNMEKAAHYYEKALKLDKDYLIGRIFMGWYLLKQGNLKKAEKYFDRVLDKSPYAVEAAAGMGKSLWKRGKKSEAVFWFRRALALGYSDPDMEQIVKKFELDDRD